MKYYLAPNSALHSAPDSAPHTPSSFQKKTCALRRTCFQKHPLFTTFLLVFAVDELCYISNKYQPPNNLAKYQYFGTRDFISRFHFEKKNCTLHRKRFWKHPLFTTFSPFLTGGEVFNTSSKCWLPNESANKIFLRKTLYSPPLFQKNNLCSPLQMLLETSTFYDIFSNFQSGWTVLYFK